MADNQMALAAYVARTESIRRQAQALLDAAQDHFGTAPEDVTWADVGSLAHVDERLKELLTFLNIKLGEDGNG